MPEVLSGLRELGIVEGPSDVAFARVRHLAHAYVIYDRERAPALATIEAFLDSLGIVSSGRYGAWNYSSMEDALEFGRAAANRALGLVRR